MATSIDDAFADLVELLADATVTFDGNPVPVDNVAAFVLNPVTPPFIEVLPSVSDDYLTFDDEGLMLGHTVVHGTALVAVPEADNDIVIGQINDLTLQIIAAVNPSPTWWVVRVTRPQGVEVNGQVYPGVAVELAAQVPLI
jgi:hypothetical protein